MLSEARARLANTQGKKAKRKAREKQLEESRRLAALQKRRELKAAGIELKYRKKTKGMNYNADIPFHKRAPAGFWDTTEEHERELKEKRDQTNVLLQKLEGKHRADIEEAERKKDIKRQKQRKEKGETVPQAALKALDEQKKIRTERRKLVLPAPQISESELEEIAKIGYSSEKLISDSVSSTASTPLSTPLSTPRLLESQRSSHNQLSGGRTPVRDEMGINTPMSTTSSMAGGETPRMERARQNLIRKQLNEQFSKLPKPKNDFELIVPSKEEDAELAKEEQGDAMEEDAEDVRARERKQREEAEAIRKKLQSHSVQEDLPRPHLLEFDEIFNQATNDIEKEIALEMIAMMAFDAKKNPYPPNQSFGKMEEPSVIEVVANSTHNDTKYTLEELEEAQQLIDEEMNTMMKKIKIKDIDAEFEKTHDKIEKEETFVFDPETKSSLYKPTKKMTKDEKIQNLKAQLESNRSKMSKEAAKARKLEKRLGIILGGYQNRGQRLKKDINEQWKLLEQATIEYKAYNDLKQNEENVIISHREEELKKSVQELEQRENELQQKYRELMAEYNTLL